MASRLRSSRPLRFEDEDPEGPANWSGDRIPDWWDFVYRQGTTLGSISTGLAQVGRELFFDFFPNFIF